MNIKHWGEITKKNCTRDTLRRHCDHDTTWERKPKRNLKGRGFKSKCLPIFVCYYYELLSSVPWCYILQALSPLVYYFYYTVMIEKGWSKILRSKKEILGIFRACCWSVLYYGKSEGQWVRCLKIGRNLGQIYWSWRSWNPPPLPAQNQTKIPSKLFFLYPMEWSGSPRNESIWTKYRNENIPIFLN